MVNTDAGTAAEGITYIKRLIAAWDCCATCAGGVIAERDREVRAVERDRLLGRIEALTEASFDAYLSVAPMVRMRCVAEHAYRVLLAEERGR